MEHITTKESVQYIKDCTNNVKATITLHHLCNNRNDMLGNGIKPHLYCMPILKRTDHQKKTHRSCYQWIKKILLWI